MRIVVLMMVKILGILR